MARIVSVYERIQWKPRPDIQGQTWLGEIDGNPCMLVCRNPDSPDSRQQFVGMINRAVRVCGPSPRQVITQMRSIATALLLDEEQKAA